ncbi:baseplate assembly protein [Bradyrhizobium sp. 613_E4_N2_2]|uniref:baseplate assembly protein n=1 Tax=Bradyrhizobium sp. 613_E4_N2_2 TaxID=3240371 RepID=UPI003F8ADB4B
MAGAFTNVNLSQLAPPVIVEQIDFEVIFAAMLADLVARYPSFSALVESDPAYAILEVAAYREVLLRQRVNEAALGCMLAYARGSDLDQLGANVNVERRVITPADPTTTPPTAAVLEDDEEFRARIQLSFEGYTTAGSEGSYVYHALSADGDVLDASATSPSPGVVDVYVLSRTGNGEASSELVDIVDAALNADDVRPMTDNVTVQTATIEEYAITAELTLYPGPDANVVRQAAVDAVTAYAASVHRIGFDVTLAGIIGALVQVGVQNVALTSPAADIVIDDTQASFCTDITVTVAGSTDV